MGRFAAADPINVSIDTSKLGVSMNFSCGTQGACGAVSSVNSFTYLQRQYPGVYGTMLLPNYDPVTNTADADAQDFGFDGWQVGMNPMRRGYYDPMRPHNADYTDSFLQTKKDWINDHAPGTTVFNSWFPGSTDNDRKPTIQDLATEIEHGEDVEIFVRREGFYHVMTLTGIECDMAMNCTIKWQDPNDPAQPMPNQTMAKIYSAPVTVMDGMIMFGGVLGAGGTVTLTAAFSESPIPEPAALMLFAVGVCGLLVQARRQRQFP
jgi:hypothetical protein